MDLREVGKRFEGPRAVNEARLRRLGNLHELELGVVRNLQRIELRKPCIHSEKQLDQHCPSEKAF